MQSGLWVSNQERYDQLVDRTGGARLTLSGAFHRAGWRTVADVPANRSDWPQGRAFYGFDTVYDSRNVGYAGPGFGYGPIPDQFTLAALERAELRPGPRPRVMAEVDLVTSHLPWAPLPRLVGWSAVGDGSVYAGMPALGPSPDVVWRDRTSVRAAYTRSIVYSLESLVSFLEHTSDRHLVLVVLGDHQPATVVSGAGSGHDVPVTVVARDPAVLSQISGWGWTAGLRPGSAAPVWRMDAFRDRFLTAFGPGPTLAAAPVAR
jgi:hypothetical protein